MIEAPYLKIVSLNVERSKHFDRVFPFLQYEQPDVCCIQELCEDDIEHFEVALNARCYFAPMSIFPDNGLGQTCLLGVGIFSRIPISECGVRYYVESTDLIPEYNHPDQSTVNRVLLYGDICTGDRVFRIGTTHFTWSASGTANEEQRHDVSKLINALVEVGEIVFTGDFNAPRGREIFSLLANKFKDNVPTEYTTSIDGNHHREGALPYMVDGIFSTPKYIVSEVRMVCGISDHCALVGKVLITGNTPRS